ncbi:MAG: hypothetical protein AAF725_01385 [Acidobacteriota bacterium]
MFFSSPTPPLPFAAAGAARSLRSALPCLLVAALLAPLVSCGKKGDPLPPLRIVPLPTQDLKVRQQGSWIQLELAYPATTVSGAALGGIDTLELHQLSKPALSDGAAPSATAQEFNAGADILMTLRGTELDSAIVGDRVQFRLPLADPLPDPVMGSIYAVRTTKGPEVSDFSNRVVLVPVEPPTPPRGLEVEGLRNGVELRWQSGDAEGFDVFRRLATERGYGAPVASGIAGDERRTVDRGARYGQRYIYTVRAITGQEPRVESDLSGEVEIDYVDSFPPRLPSNIVALPERGAIRLRWDPSPDRDTAGYFIHRRDAGRETFVRLNDRPLAPTQYTDRNLASGLPFVYRIQAVDGEGNESELSPPVTATTR